MEVASFIVKWFQGPHEDRVGWLLKCSRPSGKFFGEITDFSGRSQRTISGIMSEADFRNVCNLVDQIREQTPQPNPPLDKVGWSGLLALGTIARQEVVMRYYTINENKSTADDLFVEMINLLCKYTTG